MVHALLRPFLRQRGRRKAALLAPWLPAPGGTVLDLGAGEGYVGDALTRAGARVTLADVLDFHRVALPFVPLAPGAPLPFAADAFDAVVLVYVLHHADNAESLVREALRVARRVVVLESIYANPAEHRTLDVLDRAANRLRSAGAMQAQEAHLHFRTHAQWRAFFAARADLIHARSIGRWPHRRGLYVLDRR